MFQSIEKVRDSFRSVVIKHISPPRFWFGFLFASLLASGCQEPNVYQPPPPPKVTVAQPVQQTVDIFLEENGQTEAVGRSEVRSRVQGFLEEIKFDPGKDVKKGDLLYVIEKDEYVAARNGAKAELAAANAALQSAIAAIQVKKADLIAAEVKVEASESEFRRQDQLYKDKVVSKSVWEEAKALRDGSLAARLQAQAAIDAANANKQTAEANVARAKASLQKAELNLSYTDVRALISGRITNTQVKLGNLVESGTHLTTIVQREPIWANFNIDERHLLLLVNEHSETDGNSDEFDYKSIKVFLQRAGDDGFPFQGHLDYIDQEGVDQGTGTLKLRAVFQNPTNQLFPGLFVRVRVPIGKLENALLVPEKAVGRDQSGPYLLIVNSEQVVERKIVTLGTKYGELVVIEQGISPDARVVIDGIQRARPGSKVDAESVTLSFDAKRNGDKDKKEQQQASDSQPEKPEQ